MQRHGYVIITSFLVRFGSYYLESEDSPKLSINCVRLQNGIEKYLTRRHCYVLVGKGCDNTHIIVTLKRGVVETSP